jgi:hypothetical protein
MKQLVKRSNVGHVGNLRYAKLSLFVFVVEEKLKPRGFGRISSRPRDKIAFGEQLVRNVAADEATDTSHKDSGAGQQNGVGDGRHLLDDFKLCKCSGLSHHIVISLQTGLIYMIFAACRVPFILLLCPSVGE